MNLQKLFRRAHSFPEISLFPLHFKTYPWNTVIYIFTLLWYNITGVKSADALYAACAIFAHCNYMLTTDDCLLKYKSDKIKVVNPTEFIMILGVTEDDE